MIFLVREDFVAQGCASLKVNFQTQLHFRFKLRAQLPLVVCISNQTYM